MASGRFPRLRADSPPGRTAFMEDQAVHYDLVWWIGVGVGAFSALVHLPIREERAAVPA